MYGKVLSSISQRSEIWDGDEAPSMISSLASSTPHSCISLDDVAVEVVAKPTPVIQV